MLKKAKALFTLFFAVFSFVNCNREPYKPDTTLVAGYVIGKEICHTDETQDYWLVDLTYRTHTPQYGDTIFFKGRTYTNVVKTKGLADTAKHINTPLDIEFKTITLIKLQQLDAMFPIRNL